MARAPQGQSAKSDESNPSLLNQMGQGGDPNVKVAAEKQGEDAPAAPVSEEVTYLPGEDDPPKVAWAGHVFHANVPKIVTNATLIESARKNKFFHVGAFDPHKHAVKVAEAPPTPKTAEQYRAHAVNWLKQVDSVEELDTKWASEEKLRKDCEVGSDDLDFLETLFAPRRAELKKKDMPG